MAAALLRGSDTHPRRSSLASRMDRVLEQLPRVRKSADVDAVHNLRVAIRRCRAVAAIMEEVDAHPAWRKMRRLPRSLFHALGTLRDLQVLEEWVKRLTQDPLRSELLKALEGRQVPARRLAAEAVRKFDRQKWEHLARTLRKRAGLVPTNSPTTRALVLERYEAMRRLHTRAMDTKSPKSWHTLRVELKRFRYAVESVLPVRLAAWEEGLKQMQNLLGETHDLGVLDAWIARKSNQGGPVRLLRQRIEAEHQALIERYRQR